mmetsp:Transcript_25112/g.73510  ORF Transcript_25112/g.73510 Transcript_25112/m.73510 type:complete len:255 (-) Transcript_25112:57-821(-)
MLTCGIADGSSDRLRRFTLRSPCLLQRPRLHRRPPPPYPHPLRCHLPQPLHPRCRPLAPIVRQPSRSKRQHGLGHIKPHPHRSRLSRHTTPRRGLHRPCLFLQRGCCCWGRSLLALFSGLSSRLRSGCACGSLVLDTGGCGALSVNIGEERQRSHSGMTLPVSWTMTAVVTSAICDFNLHPERIRGIRRRRQAQAWARYRSCRRWLTLTAVQSARPWGVGAAADRWRCAMRDAGDAGCSGHVGAHGGWWSVRAG